MKRLIKIHLYLMKRHFRENWVYYIPMIIFFLIAFFAPVLFPHKENDHDYEDSPIPQQYLGPDSLSRSREFYTS